MKLIKYFAFLSIILSIGFLYLAVDRLLNEVFIAVKHSSQLQLEKQLDNVKQRMIEDLITNKRMMDAAFEGVVDKATIKKRLDKYLFVVPKELLKSIYFVSDNWTVSFLYPNFTRPIALNSAPISGIKQLKRDIEIAKSYSKSLYFNSTFYNFKKHKNTTALLLIKPIFFKKYIGSIVEIVDINGRLTGNISYLKDYEIVVSSKPSSQLRYKNALISSSIVFVDFAVLHLFLIKHSPLLFFVKNKLKRAELIIIVLIFVAVGIAISGAVVLALRIKREKEKEIMLKRLNKRLRLINSIFSIKGEYITSQNIEEILKALKDVFNADLAGIFLKQKNIYYTYDGSLKTDNYVNIEGSILRLSWKKKESILLNDYYSSHLISKEAKLKSRQKKAMCALIAYNNRYFGVMCVGRASDHNFKREDFNFLKLLGAIIATNIHHSTMMESVIETLLNAIEARDKYTEGHSRRVGEYARFIAYVMGFDDEFQKKIYMAGLFHDVGKIGIPDVILLKPTRLSKNEYEIMKLHAVFSYEILKNSEMLADVLDGIRGHHERFDGKGYPDGLKGEDIPLSARILAVADSFDAITTTRPYKSAMMLQQTKEELLRNSGSQFDPEIIEKILPYIEEMYNMGNQLKKQRSILPDYIDSVRRDMFYKDWFSGLFSMDKLHLLIGDLIAKGVEFSVCRIVVEDYYKVWFEKSKRDADSIILAVADILKENVPEEAARSENVFTFIVKSVDSPQLFVKTLISTIQSKVDCHLSFACMRYPEDARSVEEIIYKLDRLYRKVS